MKLIECLKIEILYIDVDYVKFHLMILSRQLPSYIALICKQNDNNKKNSISLIFFLFFFLFLFLLMLHISLSFKIVEIKQQVVKFHSFFFLTFSHFCRLRIVDILNGTLTVQFFHVKISFENCINVDIIC